jgi:hypothetical protein
MPVYQLQTGSLVKYRVGEVLAPDVVTERLALEASTALTERDWPEHPPTLLELGIGSAAFSRFVLDTSGVCIDVTGVDTNDKAIAAAGLNLSGHKKLKNLTLIHGDWHDEAAFGNGPFDCIYFNPPYRTPGHKLRPEFADSPVSAVFSDNPQEQYISLLPRIVENLAIGGIAIVRYPGDGSLTFAGKDAKADHNPWVSLAELDRTLERLINRSARLNAIMPADTRSHMWRSEIAGRRVNAEIFTRIGDDIANAPRRIRDMEASLKTYDE